MPSKIDVMKKELKELIRKGNWLYLSLLNDVQGLPKEVKKDLDKKMISCLTLKMSMRHGTLNHL